MEALAAVKVLHWGNSYGLRISKHDVERLGLVPGMEVAVSLVAQDDTIDVPWFTFSSGHTDTSTNHDEVLYGWQRNVHGEPDPDGDA